MQRVLRLMVASALLSFACGKGAPPKASASKIMAARAAGLTQAQKDGIFDHCSYDVQKFCPSIRRSDKNYFRKAASCLHLHAQDITDDCSNAFQVICGPSGDDCDFRHAVEGPGFGRDQCKPAQNEYQHKCYEPCARNLVFYQGKCINFKTDPDNCGDIGNQCDVPGGDPCVDGQCEATCPDQGQTTDCAGSCADLSIDPQNCGACGKSCRSSETCVSGACTPPPCDPNQCPKVEHATAVCNKDSCGFTCVQGYQLSQDGKSCVARCEAPSCTARGANCGTITNDCGSANCGSCTAPQTCGGGGKANVCGGTTCTPATCTSKGATCGTLPDDCGGTLQCGSCTAPQTCGGGGKANVCGGAVSTPPTANAGPDQDVDRSSAVTLDGSGSTSPSGHTLTYEWTQVLGPDVTGGSGKLAAVVHPVFTAPAQVTTLQFDLVVIDGLLRSAPSRVQINVLKSAARGVFVSTEGNDLNDGSRAHPLRRIQSGLSKAAGLGADVYVRTGSYPETLTLLDGVSIFGGFGAGWVRSADPGTSIDSPSTVAVSGNALGSAIDLDQVAISSANATSAGGSSVGVRISNSTGTVTLRNSTVQAGAGAPGLPAPSGARGTDGNAGRAGATGGAAGGGSSACAAPGGNGGNSVSGPVPGAQGSNGIEAFPGGAGGSGGAGGFAGSNCCSSGNGGNGAGAGPGLAGNGGASGAVGPGAGGLSASGDYVPPQGGSGNPGTPGGGGGGGGSGGGSASGCPFSCSPRTSGGGGGGGGGGCGGTSGGGGQGGGASFAVVSLSSRVTIQGTRLSSAAGGTGGVGGNGGGGGFGGPGGPGGGGETFTGQGGIGATGGTGGAAGGGAGGAGGPSACVAYSGTAPVLTSETCTRGAGGAGGAGGTGAFGPAPAGTGGLGGETLSL